MSANPKHLYTLDEYFALELAGDARYEYWDGEIVCMSGGSKAHSRISSNVHYQLRSQLASKGCEVFTSDQAVRTPALPPYRYPDVTITCGEAEFEQIRGIDTLTNPTIIVEVTSPTSEERDKEAKPQMYKQIPSLKEYLVIAQDKPLVIQHAKQSDGSWTTETIMGLSATATLSSIGCKLGLSAVYENVQLEG